MYALIKLNLLLFFLFLLRILDSCTGLMKAIRELILKSKDLQDEIVAEGRVRNAMGVMAKNCYYPISIWIHYYYGWLLITARSDSRAYSIHQFIKPMLSWTELAMAKDWAYNLSWTLYWNYKISCDILFWEHRGISLKRTSLVQSFCLIEMSTLWRLFLMNFPYLTSITS